MHTATARGLIPADVVEGATIHVAHGTMYVEARITDVKTRHHVRHRDARGYGDVVAEADSIEYRYKTVTTGSESSGSFAPRWVTRTHHEGANAVTDDEAAATSDTLVFTSTDDRGLPYHVILDPDVDDLTVPVADLLGSHALVDVAVPGVTDPAEARRMIADALTAAGMVLLGDPTPRPYTDQRVNTFAGWDPDDRRATGIGILEVEAHCLTGHHVGVGITQYLPPGTTVGSALTGAVPAGSS